ncbi:MAG: META domain-containing protein [Chloroflexota bacterium]
MKRVLITMGLLLVVALAACSNQPTVEEPVDIADTAVESVPTEALPTELPTVEVPVETVPSEEPMTFVADPMLIGTVWEWTSTTTPVEEISVTDPSRYAVLFNEDGTANIQADCNVVLATYVTDGNGAISIMPGPTTLAACADDSQDQTFLAGLTAASLYFFQDGDLFIDQFADSGTMRFMPAAEAESLTGTTWLWQGTTTAVEEIVAVDPARYTVTFNEDGTANIQADCNTVLATYSTGDDGAITMAMGPSTLVACEADSQDQIFIQQLSNSAIYFFQDGDLYIDLFADAGTMHFTAAEAPSLTGTTWLWQGTTTPVEEITVADSTRYTIMFNEDGSAHIQADCNVVLMTYTTDENGALTLLPGPSTLAACPEDSQDQVFIQQLSSSAIYFFQDGDLYIDLFADGGTMHFVAVPEVELPDAAEGEPVGTVNAPDGVFLRSGPGTNYPAVATAAQGESGLLVGISEDGQWFAADAPDMPGGMVWVSATFVDAVNIENLPVMAAPVAADSLVGPTWQWVSLTTPVEQVEVADPSLYTIVFNADGTANIKADCNSILADYTVDGNTINMVLGPTTLVFCGEESQDQVFTQGLSNSAIFFFGWQPVH